jgi:AbrB family looped-hinge helix DNA binding protein
VLAGPGDAGLHKCERSLLRWGCAVAVGRAEKPSEVTIRGRGQVSLPARRLRALGWRPGDHLLVERVGDALVLIRRPDDWTEEVARVLRAASKGSGRRRRRYSGAAAGPRLAEAEQPSDLC